MVDYKKWIDVLKQGKYGPHILDMSDIIEINKLLVMIEQKNNLNDIAEQIAMWRLMCEDKIAKYLETGEKMLESFFKEIEIVSPIIKENKMSEKDKTGDGVTTEQAGSQEAVSAQTIALLSGKIRALGERIFDTENKLATLETKEETLAGKVAAMTGG